MDTPKILIVSAYEESNLTVEEIAEVEELDVEIVKEILLQNSSIYRKNLSKKDSSTEFSKEEEEAIKNRILDIALKSNNESLNWKACRYLHEEIKGRNHQRAFKNQTIENHALLPFKIPARQLIEASSRAKEITDKIVDVEVI